MRKEIMIGGIIILLALFTTGGFVFGVHSADSARETMTVLETEQTLNAVSAIEQFRTERQQLRQMQKDQLNEMIYGGNADAEIVAMAQRKLLELMDWEEKEVTLEGVLRLREFEDVVVTVHTDSVNVMVRSDVLTQQQTAVILELVLRETGISGGNVKIIPIN